jgi:phage host-nuclease inhibitor protein Gam
MDVFAIIIICATFASIAIIMMNMKREMVSIDKEIADITSLNENYRSQIENQRKEVEALKNSKAVEYAMSHKMIRPQIGMTKDLDSNYGMDERIMYARQGKYRKGQHNVASLQRFTPQFLKRHLENN